MHDQIRRHSNRTPFSAPPTMVLRPGWARWRERLSVSPTSANASKITSWRDWMTLCVQPPGRRETRSPAIPVPLLCPSRCSHTPSRYRGAPFLTHHASGTACAAHFEATVRILGCHHNVHQRAQRELSGGNLLSLNSPPEGASAAARPAGLSESHDRRNPNSAAALRRNSGRALAHR